MFDQIPVNKSWCAQAELAAGSVGARSEENGEFEDAGPIKSAGIDGEQLDGDFLLGMSFIPPNILGCLYLYVYRIRGIYDIDILYIPCSTYFIYAYIHAYNSPPARWGLLDFMSVAWSSSSSSSSSRCPPRPPAQLRLAIHSVLCRTSTTTIHAQCSLPDLNHDHPRPVFPAGPQPRPSTPSVPCRTSTASIHAQCSLPDLNREYPRQVFPAGPHVGRYAR